MAKQAERRAATTEAILTAARRLFGTRLCRDHDGRDRGSRRRRQGRGLSSLRDQGGGVRSGVRPGLARPRVEIDRAARAEKDVLAAMVAGTQHYFAACAKGPTGQIILRDGPAVLGWERWREIDASILAARCRARCGGDGGRPDRKATGRAAGAAAARRGDGGRGRLRRARGYRKGGAEYARAFKSLVEALRLRA